MIRAAFAAACLMVGIGAQPALRVTTFNVRYGTAPDLEHAWPHRRELVQEVIVGMAPHVLGLQEALGFQLREIAAYLPAHRVLGEDRRGGSADEYSALLVDERRLEIEAHGQFWLSDTPEEVGSVGWDAALPRICTWAVLRDRTAGNRFQVLNTHFDHRGAEARRASAALLVAHAARRELPTVLMGDLNAALDSPPLQVLRDAGYRDTIRLRYPDAKPLGTFTDFRDIVGTRQIDHILVRGPWVTTEAEIVQWQRDGRFPSDHLPVRAELVGMSEATPNLVPSLDEESVTLTEGLRHARGHTVWRDAAGAWHLLAGGGAGWRGQALLAAGWTRARDGREDPQPERTAPFVFRTDRWWRIAAGAPDPDGMRTFTLASSDDGLAFADEAAPAFTQAHATDPMVMAVGDRFYCYYACDDGAPRIQARVSPDLRSWSDPVDVCFGARAGAGRGSASAPFVVHRGGWFFLLRTGLAEVAGLGRVTYVYRSTDPLDFGRGQDAALVGVLPVAGAEIVADDAAEFVTCERTPARGIRVRRLRWRK